MAVDICIIILTAFAIFGGYCMAEMVSDYIDSKQRPPSVTVMVYRDDDYAYKKVKHIYENMYNNRIVFINPENKPVVYPDSAVVKDYDISQILEDVLFTKNN